MTHFCAAPTVLISLVNHPAAPAEPLARKLIVSTAAAPPLADDHPPVRGAGGRDCPMSTD